MQDTLSACFGFNHFTITRNLEGLDEALSLRRPEGGGNCANWLLGHMLYSRSQILESLEAPAPLDLEKDVVYARGADPDSAGLRPFEDLLAFLEDSQKHLLLAFAAQSDEDWREAISLGPVRDQPRHRVLTLFSLHESYHSGQLGALRPRLGLPAAIR